MDIKKKILNPVANFWWGLVMIKVHRFCLIYISQGALLCQLYYILCDCSFTVAAGLSLFERDSHLTGREGLMGQINEYTYIHFYYYFKALLSFASAHYLQYGEFSYCNIQYLLSSSVLTSQSTLIYNCST